MTRIKLADKSTSTVELRIHGANQAQSLIHTLTPGQAVRIGRAPQNGLIIPWDRLISREHADLTWDGKRLHVVCQESARNPIILGSQLLRRADIGVGGSFLIGTTTFHVSHPFAGGFETMDLAKHEEEEDEAATEQSYSFEELRNIRFGDANRQLETLSRLPDLISNSQSDTDLAALVAGLLLQAISGADGVAVAQFDLDTVNGSEELPTPRMLQVGTRENYQGRFRPSRRLIAKTLRHRESHIHLWDGGSQSSECTLSEGLGWAFCAPIRGESCNGWCLYVSGKSPVTTFGNESLKSDLRFTELVAQFIGSVRQVRLLQEHKTQLSTFFSPKVIENLTGKSGADSLEPAERDVSVLFCDVRGFSRKSEAMAGDLHSLLKSVREALGVMSKGILDHDGTIADFQGDAALGFWGWPVELAEGALPACLAALSIYAGFQAGTDDPSSLLHGFSVGMGIVHGRAIAGQIGTAKQAKVGVFGPVVNQGARLEGLTKQLGVPICIDDRTADWVKRLLPASEARVRKLARVRPAGMANALDVYQLLPPEGLDTVLKDESIATYEAALDSVLNGHWSEAIPLLESMPPDDGPSCFLLQKMAAANHTPPPDWDGAFRLTSK